MRAQANRSDQLRVLFYLTLRSAASGADDSELGDEGGGAPAAVSMTLEELMASLEAP